MNPVSSKRTANSLSTLFRPNALGKFHFGFQQLVHTLRRQVEAIALSLINTNRR